LTDTFCGPDHINYFTPRHMRRMLDDAGFKPVLFPWHWRMPTSDNMWAAAF